MTNPCPGPSPFRRTRLPEFADVPLYAATLHDLFEAFGMDGKLDYTSASGNRIVCDGSPSERSMKNTRVCFSGKGNVIHLGPLAGIQRLDIACAGGSEVHIGRTNIIRGATVMASKRAAISLGDGCMLSRDIVIYASGAHGVYNSADGARRGSAQIGISDHVWLGQGVKVLGGARVGSGSIIGSYAVLAGKIPNNCAAAGNPCRVTSRDVFWTIESITDNYFYHLENAGRPFPSYVQMTKDD